MFVAVSSGRLRVGNKAVNPGLVLLCSGEAGTVDFC